MKTRLLLLGLGLLLAPGAFAQLTLHDFSAFASPNTFFTGDWELNGDPVGTNSPRATFSQGVGFYNFAGGSNDASASALYFFEVPLDISGFSLLQISARSPSGSAASFDVTLFDLGGNSTVVTFATAAFGGPGFTTVSTALNLAGFDVTQLAAFQLSGGVLGGTDTLNLAVNHLAVSAPPVVAVPEPATYGILAIFALLGIVARRYFLRVA